MGLEGIALPPGVPPRPADPQRLDAETRERLIVLSFEFSRRAVEARSFEELCFLMTNDIRALIEFDRAFLITHMRGQSTFTGASNQPILDSKSKFNEELNRLAVQLATLDKPLLIKNLSDIDGISDDSLTPELKEALSSYMQFAKCTGMLCLPLNCGNETLGHLLLEYLDGGCPDQPQTIAAAKLAPFFASALAHRWILTQYPEIAPLTAHVSWRKKPVIEFLSRYLIAIAATVVILVVVLFIIPFAHPVGGEAEIAPRDRHVAFTKIDGLIDRINVLEGTIVKEGQVIATLDPTDLDFKIQGSQRQLELLTAEMTLLKHSSGPDVSKLAEGRLTELKIKSVSTELKYLQWQRQFLEIKAPVSGIITTKSIETLIGKKFKAGEPFCEIAVPGDLCTEIYVPEDKISRITSGQQGELNLNNQPTTAYPIQVQEVAPRAEVIQRLGNVYRVKAAFVGHEPPPLKVGMKGVGTIYTEKTNLYSIITQRLYARWNQFVLYFL